MNKILYGFRAQSALAIVALLLNPTLALGQDFYLPADAGVINVKTDLVALGIHPTNAAGNGSTDDTLAIKAAITHAINRADRYAAPPFVYFPNGTYVVSDTLNNRISTSGFSFGWRAGMILYGQSRANTVIKLKNNTPAFSSASNPKSVIYMGTENGDTNGNNNQEAFRNSVFNMTVDTGNGNPGAIGINFFASNRGAIENVTVRSGSNQGLAGISAMRNLAGPSLIKNVEVQGFKRGIEIGNWEWGHTLENITVTNQLEVGFYQSNNSVSMRGFTSSNTVPAIINNSINGHCVIIDANLSGGGSANTAITNRGFMWLRNVTATGYGVLVALAWRLVIFFEGLQFFISSFYPINNTNPPPNPR